MKVGSLFLRSRVIVRSHFNRPITTRLLTTIVTDVTGNNVKVGHLSSLNLLDEAIFNIISSEDECSSQLCELLKDKECTMARSLLLFDMLSQGNTTLTLEKGNQLSVDSLLVYLEDKAKQNQLDTREMHLAAAGLAFSEGNFLVSAKVLSSLSQEQSFDALNLKLTQLSYKKAGDFSNYFSCIAQCSDILNNKHHLYGHLQGMLALGHIENGRFQQAEDTANRAISLTRGKDISAIEAVLQSYQLSGRTTEVFAILEAHKTHHDDYSKPLLLFHDAMSKIQRGNYNGGARNFEVIVDHADDNPTHYPIQSVVYATMILWQLSINTVNPDVALLWHDECYTRCWKRVEQINTNEYVHDPLFDICRTMYLYRTSIAILPSKTTSSSDTTVTTPPQQRGLGIWQWLETTTKKHRNKKAKEAFQLMDPLVAQQMLTSHLQRLQFHSSSSLLSSSSSSSSSHDIIHKNKQLLYPTLRSFQNKYANRELNQAESKRQQTFAISYALSQAVISFMKQNYQTACNQFKELSEDINKLGGSSAVEREIFKYHTLLEALLRINDDDDDNDHDGDNGDDVNQKQSTQTIKTDITGVGSDGVMAVKIDNNSNTNSTTNSTTNRETSNSQQLPPHLEEAKRLCNERVILCVNDAQAWRRLSSLLGRCGQYELAHFAHHTAWQLGIGQGGFGGPQ